MPQIGSIMKDGTVNCPEYHKISSYECSYIRDSGSCGYCVVCRIITECKDCNNDELYLVSTTNGVYWECQNCSWRSAKFDAKYLEGSIPALAERSLLKTKNKCNRTECDNDVKESGNLCKSCSAINLEAESHGMSMDEWLKMRKEEIAKAVRLRDRSRKRRNYSPEKEAVLDKSKGKKCLGFPPGEGKCGTPITNRAKLCKACDSARRSHEAKSKRKYGSKKKTSNKGNGKKKERTIVSKNKPSVVDVSFSCKIEGSSVDPWPMVKSTISVETETGFKMNQICNGDLDVVISSLQKAIKTLRSQEQSIMKQHEP